MSGLIKWTCEYAVHLLHTTTGYMVARIRRVLAMDAEFVFFPCREKRRVLIWNNGQERGSGVGRITVGLQCDGMIASRPSGFSRGRASQANARGRRRKPLFSAEAQRWRNPITCHWTSEDWREKTKTKKTSFFIFSLARLPRCARSLTRATSRRSLEVYP